MVIEKERITSILKMTKPYTDQSLIQHGTDIKYTVRTFSADVDEEELVWRRDKESRTIHVLSGNGWELQKEDKLPEELQIGKNYFIIKNNYHRVIKGEGDLVLRIDNGYTTTRNE